MGFACDMKFNWQSPFLLTALLLLSPVFSIRAQDAAPSTNAISGDNATNDAVTLKDLMSSNNIVTNTVGVVLVKISPGLWAGKYEMTQDAYQKVMHLNPSAFQGRQNPVDSVSWNDAMAFCQKLTAKEQTAKELPDGYAYTLPTEAQWQMLVGDASLKDAVMVLNGNSHSSTSPVGSLGPNSLGLYDTRGNVMEWCLDSHDPTYRVLRGGAWDTSIEVNSRIEFRWYSGSLDEKKNSFGFRVVLEQGGTN
jgi:formylglycine-generating enzyme required for sulfatase activity